jgi:hypothetical protein
VLTFSSRTKEDEMKTQHHQVITKILVSEAIALGSWVAGATAASAEPNPFGTDPNPFGSLTCSCQETTPADGQAVTAELDRGIRNAFTSG